MTKTYGDKPLVFAFDGDGEQYMIGSEVNIFCPISMLYYLDVTTQNNYHLTAYEMYLFIDVLKWIAD